MPDDLTNLLHQLQDARQRATYGAVAGVVNAVPMFLMSNRPRNHLHSWVVNAQTGLPTHYEPEDMHPDMLATDRVLKTEEELREWLAAPNQ